MSSMNIIQLPTNTNTYGGQYIRGGDVITPSSPGGAQYESHGNYPSSTGAIAQVYAYYLFSTAFYVTEIQYHMQSDGSTYANNGGGGGSSIILQYLDINSNWQTIYSASQSCGSQSGTNTDSGAIDTTGFNTWCRGFYISASSSYGSGDDKPNCNAYANIYYLNAFAQVYYDSGLSIYSPIHGNVRVGYEPGGSSTDPLRIYNGGTLPIPLLSTSDPNASPARVRFNGSTYSLPNANQ